MVYALQRSAIVFVGGLTVTLAAPAQTRMVIVNGQHMNDAQVATLEQRACTRIPNGAYWLDLRTGAWGYANNPRVQGVFGESCGSRQPGSLSERRQLYRPGEILSQ
jgi:hypothetical protein